MHIGYVNWRSYINGILSIRYIQNNRWIQLIWNILELKWIIYVSIDKSGCIDIHLCDGEKWDYRNGWGPSLRLPLLRYSIIIGIIQKNHSWFFVSFKRKIAINMISSLGKLGIINSISYNWSRSEPILKQLLTLGGQPIPVIIYIWNRFLTGKNCSFHDECLNK